MHRIFQMFEFAASGGAVSQKRLHQKRSLFSNCLVVVGGKFKHHKFLENVKFEKTNNIDSISEQKSNNFGPKHQFSNLNGRQTGVVRTGVDKIESDSVIIEFVTLKERCKLYTKIHRV